ncbi:hypothetical protein KUTeg_003072 [Tegillarca granosa]|uniref:Peroxisomal 2,4-dienoyl-CoA reductase [(3E)-enoyl-CoA-producing] n=1 Tax=Tegillarca granosa TaxID=220873 RepID=A0ABQ9FPA0_TEGGR|nr:hypothetical protein KUTeg_003072 [Tegillarca granosa]
MPIQDAKNNTQRGKVAFITGGGTGIGFTIAEVFMRHGCNVVIGSRRLGKLQESAATLQKETGGTCLPITLDVRKPETIVKAVEETLSKFGRIDYLVNNAAGNFLCPAANLSFNAFRTVMDIDAIGTFNKTGGVIVNITAMLHHRGTILQTHAGSAKAAIGGKRVNDGLIKAIPVQRMGTREEIANSVLFVISDGGQLLTGSTVIADGGSHLTGSNNYYEFQKNKSHL